MAKLLESTIERKVVRWCKKNGVLTTKLNGFGDRGKPDRVFWVRGGPILAEFKRPGEKLTKLQEHWRGIFFGLNYEVCVFRTADEAIEVLKLHL